MKHLHNRMSVLVCAGVGGLVFVHTCYITVWRCTLMMLPHAGRAEYAPVFSIIAYTLYLAALMVPQGVCCILRYDHVKLCYGHASCIPCMQACLTTHGEVCIVHCALNSANKKASRVDVQGVLDTDGVADSQRYQYLVDIALNPTFSGFNGPDDGLLQYLNDTIQKKPPGAWVAGARIARKSSLVKNWPTVLRDYTSKCVAAPHSLPRLPSAVRIPYLSSV